MVDGGYVHRAFRMPDSCAVDVLEKTSSVPLWTGREVRALREARRMSVREFAAHLGVSDRMVSKWEAGGLAIRPRPINQAALDTSLARSAAEVKARFNLAASASGTRMAGQAASARSVAVATNLVRHPEDSKLMTLVEPGLTRLGPQAEPLWLPGFYIDVYPTTNADYARFLAATEHRPPAHWPAGRFTPDQADHPVVGVSWRDAYDYARWAAKTLPSAAQWEKAARGPSGASYPWGEGPSPARCNVRESRIKGTTPVDWYENAISPYGVYDLCGNVWEWTATPGPRGWQVRGGAFSAPLTRAVPSAWIEYGPDTCRDDLGFRTVLSLDAMLELLSI
jgi:formylglycine-generating enzyme required for sulfatase activity